MGRPGAGDSGRRPNSRSIAADSGANDAGTDVSAALGIGEAAVTDQWSVTLLDVVSDAAAFDLVDYRTGALGVGDATGADGSVWIALRFHPECGGRR